MQRRLPILAGVVAIAAALAVWKCRGSGPDGGEPAGSAARATPSAIASRPRPDPQAIAKATITGTVTVEGGGPVANARVCVEGRSESLPDELLRDPVCTTTGATGGYELAVLPARYLVSAAAAPHRPSVYQRAARTADVVVAAGERKAGIDIALRTGGVELTGVVNDLTGGPIANARVWVREPWGYRGRALAQVDADEHGRFSLWVAPGRVQVGAVADGYGDVRTSASAPGKVELLLTPESSLAGTIVDAASGQPVEGARVRVSGGELETATATVTSDAEGKFRVDRLTPGRYRAIATIANGYGRSEGSTLVGLAQHVDGVVVKLWPAARVEGRVTIAGTAAPCPEPSASLREDGGDRWLPMRRRDDGALYADAVLPGTYKVSVDCDDHRARDSYEPVTVADRDVTGLVWEVETGATLRGRVLASDGKPVEAARVSARLTSGPPRARFAGGGDDTDREGRYEIGGLAPGTYKVEVTVEGGAGPRDGVDVEVTAAGGERDLRLEEVGAIAGTVVDDTGKPVAGILVGARVSSMRWGGDSSRTDDAGAFALRGLRPGEYRVTATRGAGGELRRPGTTDDDKQGERVTVTANRTATARLVVEATGAAITGTVVDAAGKPVADAFVSAARESDAAGSQRSSVTATRWSWDDRPVLTATDGAFAIGKLAAGSYTVRAYVRGGGEAIAEHVAAGTSVKLQLRATGSIAGTVRRASGAPVELVIELRDARTGLARREEFFRTEGRFTVGDLPAGRYDLVAKAEGGMSKIEVELADGEAKRGIAIELGALVTIAGRVVEHGTQKPVAGMRMMARLASGGSRGFDGDNVTGADGRFTIVNAPTGTVALVGWPQPGTELAPVNTLRTVTGSGTVDVGDIVVMRPRVKRGDPVGELGVRFAEQPRDTPPDKRERKVSYIDPGGPAAKSGLQVGDVIVSIDGVDIRGEHASNAITLLRAPPGTRLALGLARGATVAITLAAP